MICYLHYGEKGHFDLQVKFDGLRESLSKFAKYLIRQPTIFVTFLGGGSVFFPEGHWNGTLGSWDLFVCATYPLDPFLTYKYGKKQKKCASCLLANTSILQATVYFISWIPTMYNKSNNYKMYVMSVRICVSNKTHIIVTHL